MRVLNSSNIRSCWDTRAIATDKLVAVAMDIRKLTTTAAIKNFTDLLRWSVCRTELFSGKTPGDMSSGCPPVEKSSIFIMSNYAPKNHLLFTSSLKICPAYQRMNFITMQSSSEDNNSFIAEDASYPMRVQTWGNKPCRKRSLYYRLFLFFHLLGIARPFTVRRTLYSSPEFVKGQQRQTRY